MTLVYRMGYVWTIPFESWHSRSTSINEKVVIRWLCNSNWTKYVKHTGNESCLRFLAAVGLASGTSSFEVLGLVPARPADRRSRKSDVERSLRILSFLKTTGPKASRRFSTANWCCRTALNSATTPCVACLRRRCSRAFSHTTSVGIARYISGTPPFNVALLMPAAAKGFLYD